MLACRCTPHLNLTTHPNSLHFCQVQFTIAHFPDYCPAVTALTLQPSVLCLITVIHSFEFSWWFSGHVKFVVFSFSFQSPRPLCVPWFIFSQSCLHVNRVVCIRHVNHDTSIALMFSVKLAAANALLDWDLVFVESIGVFFSLLLFHFGESVLHVALDSSSCCCRPSSGSGVSCFQGCSFAKLVCNGWLLSATF